MRKLLLIFLSLCACLTASSQTYEKQRDRMLAYNVLSAGIIGGVGGAINRNEGEKWHKAFFKNFGKACLGGLVKYQAKYQTFYLGRQENTPWILPNRLHYFIGHSMVMNASLNKKLLETYYANLWGIDFRVSTQKEADKRVQARLSLGTLAGAISYMMDGHDFNLYRTLEYGHISMDLDTSVTYYGIPNIAGLGGYNLIAIRTSNNNRLMTEVLPHETIHTYQYYDTYALSSWYKKKTEPLYEDLPIYKKLKKYMVLDYEPLFNSALYAIQPEPRYFKNFYEYEAQHFAGRGYLKR